MSSESGRFESGDVPWNRRDWTVFDKIIRDNYPSMGSKAVSEILGVSRAVVMSRASELKIKCIRKMILSESAKEKISKSLKGKVKNAEWRSKLSLSLKGRKHTDERVIAIITGVTKSRRAPRKMNRPEKRVQDILELMFGQYSPFKYTGDRKFWISLEGRHKNPDFTDLFDRRIIEVFGRYWHRGEDPSHLIEKYKKAGWSCLVLWEDELGANSIDRIMKFGAPEDYEEELRIANWTRT